MSALSAASAAQNATEAASAVTKTKRRRALHAYLSEAAHDTWHQFAANNGVSISATLEALAAELDDFNDEDARIELAPIIERARQTDVNRRRRRR